MVISIADVIAGLALLLSAYATWRTLKFKTKEEEFLDLQAKVNALILEKEQREANQANRAELGAAFISIDSKNHRLKVFNKGRAAAYNVVVEFPNGNDVVLKSELEDKFPMEAIEPGQSVELIAVILFGTKAKHTVRLRWVDSDGTEQDKTIYATM